jgi:trichothecene 3-O-acetyltransferase
VRRPEFPPPDGLFYLMPRSPDGEVTAALGLRLEDLERVKADEELLEYAVYID